MMKYILLIILVLSFSACCFGADMAQCRACMTEPHSWVLGSLSLTEKRFAIYKANNVDMLRVEVDWSQAETEKGVWDISHIADYIRLARRYGFRIKLIMGVMMSPPIWYLKENPEAVIVDETGRASHFTMSYCYGMLHSVITEKTKSLINLLKKEGVWQDIDYIIPTFGPAGEPIYPHPWTMPEDYTVPRFWNYDAAGQKAWRAAMKKKYKSVDKANKVWGTDFESFDTMPLLKSGEKPGAYWNDYLVWYRDVKRDFVRWNISLIRTLAPDKQALVYIPGTAYSDADWQEAVSSGAGNVNIRMMCDSMWVMEEALRQGADLQYTGCENGNEVARLRLYLDTHGCKNAKMWGENAGAYVCAKDPLHLADVCVKNRLCGLDYTHAHYAFLPKGKSSIEDYSVLYDPNTEIEPNPVIMPKLKAAFGIVKGYNEQMERINKK